MIRLFLSITVLLFAFSVSSQRNESFQDSLPTENLDMGKDANKNANRTKRKPYNVIYRPNAKKILYGNPCAVEATRKWGFEYMVEPRNGPRSKTQKGKFLNNIRVKLGLTLKRSPFWKMILKKKFKKCRPKSGDIVG